MHKNFYILKNIKLRDENDKNKYVTRYFKTYGLFIYSTDVELDFVCFDRLSHGFNT